MLSFRRRSTHWSRMSLIESRTRRSLTEGERTRTVRESLRENLRILCTKRKIWRTQWRYPNECMSITVAKGLSLLSKKSSQRSNRVSAASASPSASQWTWLECWRSFWLWRSCGISSGSCSSTTSSSRSSTRPVLYQWSSPASFSSSSCLMRIRNPERAWRPPASTCSSPSCQVHCSLWSRSCLRAFRGRRPCLRLWSVGRPSWSISISWRSARSSPNPLSSA